MIAKMTRYDFVMHHSTTTHFLEALRELGLVDVTTKEFEPSEKQLQNIELQGRLQKSLHTLDSAKISTETPTGTSPRGVLEAVEMIEKAHSTISANNTEIIKLRTEVQRTQIWGDFDPKAIDQLRTQGLNVRLFEISAKKFDPQWHTLYNIEMIAHHGSMHYFAVVEYGETAELDGVVEFTVPENSAKTLLREIEKLEEQNAQMAEQMQAAAQHRAEIQRRIDELQDQINFSTAHSSAGSEVEGCIKIVEGFSDTLDLGVVQDFAAQHEVLMFHNAATEEENPPIKLKNSFFARLFEPIGAIYMFPRYNELDLTPFFAPFFMIFFGMCFGDAGYGLVLILAILVLWRKIPQQFRGFAWLGLFLNFSAVVFGLLTGNVFGIELVKVEALADFKHYILQPTQIFNLSLMLGGIQLSFGLILRTFNRIKRGGSFVYGVSNIGWLLLIFSSLVALSGLGGEGFSSSSVAYQICLWTAVGLILFFTVPHKPVASVGKGLYSFYETATGIVGDLISYVRLFAIGLAGGVIAQVFNALSVGLSGDIPVVSIILMVVILLVGHGLNIFISFLGAVVHPIRLTFVEFYKNAEFEGGGREFSPFKKTKK